MTVEDTLRFAVNALAQQPRRAGLSLLGVVIGVVAVLFLTAIGEGARLYVVEQFQSLGTDIIIVLPGKTETSGMLPGGVTNVPNDLTFDDANALLHHVPGVVRAAPISVGNETVSYGTRRRQAVIIGSTDDFIDLRGIEIARGSSLPRVAMDRGASVTLLGDTIARELFAEENPIGKIVRIGDWRMRVIGVAAPRGMHLGQNLDEMALVPVATGMRMFNRSSLFRIMIQLRSFQNIDDAKRKIKEIIIDRHGEEDITCLTPDSVVSSLSSILGTLTLVVTGIAAISLCVAGIGIMNVMLVAVSERTVEVGLLKAIGATRQQVLFVFLAEAILISLSGGILGLGIGLGAVQLLKQLLPVLPAQAPTWVVFAVLLVSIGTGVFFGVLPAGRAMRLDPIQALSSKK